MIPLIISRVLVRLVAQAVIFLSPVLAAETNIIRGEIIEFGNFSVRESKPDVPVRFATGEIQPSLHISKAVEFLNRTNQIIASKGSSFGFSYKLTNLPTNKLVRLNVETTHPEFILPDGKKDSGRILQIHCQTTNGVWNHRVGYRFDDDFEMVDGEWKFTIYSAEGATILTKSFTVKRN